MLQTQYYF